MFSTEPGLQDDRFFYKVISKTPIFIGVFVFFDTNRISLAEEAFRLSFVLPQIFNILGCEHKVRSLFSVQNSFSYGKICLQKAASLLFRSNGGARGYSKAYTGFPATCRRYSDSKAGSNPAVCLSSICCGLAIFLTVCKGCPTKTVRESVRERFFKAKYQPFCFSEVFEKQYGTVPCPYMDTAFFIIRAKTLVSVRCTGC